MKLPGSRMLLACWVICVALPFAHAELVLSNFDPSRPLKIMPIGDSITDDCSLSGGWRLYLEPLLRTNNYPFVFVGRQTSNPVSPSFTSVNHEGHCGAVIGPPGVFAVHSYDTTNAYLLNIVTDALAIPENRPDLVLVLAGVNDIGHGRDPYEVAQRDMSNLLDLILSSIPNAHIIIGKITSLQDAAIPGLTYSSYATNTPVYNAELQALVNRRRALGQQVYLADMFSAVDYSTMFLPDHVHPNSSGLRAIANEWMARINSITQRSNQFVSTLSHCGDEWRYADKGQDLGTNWAQMDFEDNAWSSGFARFGYGDPTVLTPLDFGPNSDDKYITTYFRRKFVLPDNLSVTNLNFRVARADGLAVWLNGQKILRLNLPPEPITYTNLALTAMTGYSSQVFVPRNAPVGALRAGTNILAVELHLSSPTNSTLGFDMELLASGFIAPRPSLSISQSPFGLVLRWPISTVAGLGLYLSTNLADRGGWVPANAAAVTNGSEVVVTQSPTGSARFFRLQTR